MSLDANVAVSNAPFSVSAGSSWNSRLRAEQETYRVGGTFMTFDAEGAKKDYEETLREEQAGEKSYVRIKP